MGGWKCYFNAENPTVRYTPPTFQASEQKASRLRHRQTARPVYRHSEPDDRIGSVRLDCGDLLSPTLLGVDRWDERKGKGWSDCPFWQPLLRILGS